MAQARPVWEKPAEGLEKALGLAGAASAAGARVICFPEQFATGWDPESSSFAEEYGGPVSSGFCTIAADCGIGVLGNFREKTPDGLRNTAIFAGADGKAVAFYSKMHLFYPEGEDKFFSPGTSPAVFDYEGVRFGIAICYDLRFPGLFEEYSRLGTECVLVQAAWPCSRVSYWKHFISTRAKENGYYVAGTNTTGRTPVDEYCGGSMAASPAGMTVAGPAEGECLIYADVDTGNIRHS